MQQTKNKQKPEITLMTLLAYEATEDAQQLLQKYKKPKAKNFADLEVKLGELYVSADDKLKLEKEPKLICEPGRALVAESGSTIVRVNLRKKQKLYIN